MSDADGSFLFKTSVAAPQPVVHDGPVGRLLHALAGPPWRPAHLHFTISAPGYERLVTQLFRRDDPYLDADAVFGVRSSLVTDWVRHEPGRTPDGHASALPFTTLDFAFVLNNTTQETRHDRTSADDEPPHLARRRRGRPGRRRSGLAARSRGRSASAARSRSPGRSSATAQIHKLVGEIYVEQLNKRGGLLGRRWSGS